MADEPVFETHEFVEKLTQAGRPPNQAAAVAEGVVQLVLANCASKSDLRALGAELRAEIRMLRTEMHGSFETVRAEMHGNLAETNLRIDALRAEMLGKSAETNSRIDVLRSDMNGGFQAVSAEFALLRTELKAMQNRIVVRLGAFIGAVAAAVGAVATIF